MSYYLTRAITKMLRRSAGAEEPAENNGTYCRITPGKITAWITIVAGLVMIAIGILAIVLSGVVFVGLIVCSLGLAIAGFMLPSLYSAHDIVWTDEFVEGASMTFGPTLGWKRSCIPWTEFARSGVTRTQYWYLETNDCQRIYWSYLYNGHEKFHEAIRNHCPGIFDQTPDPL